jgi:hypothetical protein
MIQVKAQELRQIKTRGARGHRMKLLSEPKG